MRSTQPNKSVEAPPTGCWKVEKKPLELSPWRADVLRVRPTLRLSREETGVNETPDGQSP
jgi:hypothetical protein